MTQQDAEAAASKIVRQTFGSDLPIFLTKKRKKAWTVFFQQTPPKANLGGLADLWRSSVYVRVDDVTGEAAILPDL